VLPESIERHHPYPSESSRLLYLWLLSCRIIPFISLISVQSILQIKPDIPPYKPQLSDLGATPSLPDHIVSAPLVHHPSTPIGEAALRSSLNHQQPCLELFCRRETATARSDLKRLHAQRRLVPCMGARLTALHLSKPIRTHAQAVNKVPSEAALSH
jgi:hypothetical protein